MWAPLVRHLTGPLYDRLRFGGEVGRATTELRRTDRATASELAELRHERLAALLSHAAASVPFYQEALRRAGISSAEKAAALARDPNGFAALPLLTRDLLRKRTRDLVAVDRRRHARRFRTSGSTGEPTSVLVDVRSLARHRASKARARRWLGVAPEERWAMVWGRDEPRSRLIAAAAELSENRRVFPLADLEDETRCERTVRRLSRFDPALIYGFASGLSSLANLADDAGHRRRLRLPSLRALIATAEMLSEPQWARMKARLGVRVSFEYGLTEAQFIASNCEHGTLHVADENVQVEILTNGRPTAPGEPGEIVVTDLHSYAAPLIRYVTGDVGTTRGEPCRCGRGHTGLELKIARTSELIELDGKVHHPEVFTMPHDFDYFDDICRFRVRRLGERTFQVDVMVADGKPFATIAASMERAIRDALRSSVTLDIRRVESIPRDPSGKLRFYYDARDSMGRL